MADVDSLENGLRAAELGCDWVGTTLYGYTEDTAQQCPPAFDLLPPLRAELPSSVRLICEGGIASPADARLACLLYTSPSPRDLSTSRMPSSA